MTSRRAKSAPVPAGLAQGDTYVLDNAEGHGSGLGHIPNGTQVSVVDVLAPGTAGVGASREGSVLLSYDHASHVIAEDGTHAPGSSPRAFSLHTSDFTRLFKKADA